MRPRWRLFRQEGARPAALPLSVYLALFVASLAASHWAVARYGAAVIWPANGVMLAAVLHLKRRDAIRFLIACVVLNVVENVLRHDPLRMLVANVLINVGEALMAGLITRRVCGAALDMRRPVRLMRFALMAVIPTTVLSTIVGVGVLAPPADEFVTDLVTWFTVETVGLLIVAPSLLLWAQGHRFQPGLKDAARWEPPVLFAVLAAVTVAVFAQRAEPAPFVVFLPLLIIAFRLSPRWSAASVLVVALIAAGFTLNGRGPLLLGTLGPKVWSNVALVPVLRALPLYNLFMAAVLAVSLPASAVLTERRRLEARLRQRTEAATAARRVAEDAAAAKGRFLSMMSHELRTPLNGVAGFAELLAACPELGADARRHVDGVRTSGARLLGLVEEILDVSRGELEIAWAPLCPHAVVEEAVQAAALHARAKGLQLVAENALDPRARGLGDARRLRQVLNHVLDNALKFTPAGVVSVVARSVGDAVRIAVADGGPGLDEAVLAGLYQPFSQGDSTTARAHEGAGIGLALSQRLMRRMGGGIEAANLAQGGAVFTLHLPMERLEDAPEPTPAPAPDERLAAPRVLVVDDHQTNREIARLLLQALGCEVALAVDGRDAVAAAQASSFDLVLMDVRMPGMDGLEATRAIRALPGPAAAVPIVAMTGDAMPEDVARCLAAGMDGHLAKPVSGAALCEVLETVLGGGAPAQSRAA